MARAHARSGDHIALVAYLGKNEAFDQGIVRFAEAYAEQHERDWAALVDAVRSGRIEAETGPKRTVGKGEGRCQQPSS